MTPTITREELKTQIERGTDVTLVEALPPLYYADAHLPGALNLPLDGLETLAPTLLPDTAQEIIVYCSNTACQNSTAAANRLAALGYSNVRKYAAGKQDWIEAGLPTESGVPVIVQ